LLQFDCCGSSEKLTADVFDIGMGDKPILPHQREPLELPRSLIGTIVTKTTAASTRQLVYIRKQCMAYEVIVHFHAGSESLGATDLCQPGGITIKNYIERFRPKSKRLPA
jgi:hypothetical protein